MKTSVSTTPIERVDGIFVKRDDLFSVAGVNGGKARTCWHLMQGAKGVVTASSRHSPQLVIVANIASYLGIPCLAIVPQGINTPEIIRAIKAGAKITRCKPGYNTVIIARAKKLAIDIGYRYIPFGMECVEAVMQTASQVRDIPQDVKRVVAPVGSGMSLAGILKGLRTSDINVPVLGVIVGANPLKRLDTYAPLFWPKMVDLVKAPQPYEAHCDGVSLGGIPLDPVYEAKCVPFLRDNDLFWIVGRR